MQYTLDVTVPLCVCAYVLQFAADLSVLRLQLGCLRIEIYWVRAAWVVVGLSESCRVVRWLPAYLEQVPPALFDGAKLSVGAAAAEQGLGAPLTNR